MCLLIAVGNLTADQILLTGGTVTEIIPVPDTHDYFVWVEVTPGVAALHIALTPGTYLSSQQLISTWQGSRLPLTPDILHLQPVAVCLGAVIGQACWLGLR